MGTECSLFEYLVNSWNRPNRDVLCYLGNAWTEKEFLDEAYRVREYLRAEGVGKGDVVSLMLPNIPAFCFAFYGTSANGSIISMINADTAADKVRDLLKKTKSKVLFVWDFVYGNIKQITEELSVKVVVCSIRDYAKEKYFGDLAKFDTDFSGAVRYSELPSPAERTFVKTDGKESAVYTSTGGTVSGMPKTVVTAARSLNIGAEKTAERVFIKKGFGYRDDDIAFSVTMLTYGGGYNFAVHAAIVPAGMKLVILPTQLIQLFPAVMSEFEVTFFLTIPTWYEKIVADKEKAIYLLRSCRYAITIADKMPESLRKQVEAVLPEGAALWDFYAMTEFACVAAPHNGRQIETGEYLIKEIGSDKFLGANEKGELLIDSEHVMLEYLGEGDKSDAFIFINDKKYLRSGDVGYIDNEGIFHFVDRIKRTGKIAGFDVFPAEIEAAIGSIPEIRNLVIARKKDFRGMPFLCAYIELANENDFRTVKDKVEEIILKRLNKYCLPKKFVAVEKIIKTPIGKNDFVYYESLAD